jgi:Flp pilus assembly protein TadG
MANHLRPGRGERGSAILEFIAVLPALLIILFGIIEISRLFLVVALTADAAREGARTGSVTPLSGIAFNPAPAMAQITSVLTAGGVTATDPTSVTCTPTAGAAVPCPSGSQIRATVTVLFQTVVPLLEVIFGEGGVTIQETATMRYE